MKKTITLLCSICLFALHGQSQTFTPAPGYTAQSLFPTGDGTTISGLAADSGGNLYFEVIDSMAGVTSLQRLARNIARPTGFAATADVLFNYTGSPYSGLVKIYDGQLFFSEASNFTLRAIDLRNFTVPAVPLTEASVPVIATVPNLQDLAVRSADFNAGHALNAYVSASPTFGDNQVFKLNLSTGVKTSVLNTVDDYSGPLAFDPAGRLIYGKTGSDYNAPKKAGGLYRFSAAEVSAATSQSLVLDVSHRLADNYANAFLAPGSGTTLFQAESHFHGNDLLHSYNFDGTAIELLLGTANDTNFDFSGLALSPSGNTLFVAMTDFTNYPPSSSAIFALVLPEPTTAHFLGLGAAGLLAACRRRRCR